jgi:hypothetical protein
MPIGSLVETRSFVASRLILTLNVYKLQLHDHLTKPVSEGARPRLLMRRAHYNRPRERLFEVIQFLAACGWPLGASPEHG